MDIPNYIYILQKGHNDLCKIGRGYPKQRLRAWKKKTGWQDIRLIEVFEVPDQRVVNIENTVHARLSSVQFTSETVDVGREWFSVNPSTACRVIMETIYQEPINTQSITPALEANKAALKELHSFRKDLQEHNAVIKDVVDLKKQIKKLGTNITTSSGYSDADIQEMIRDQVFKAFIASHIMILDITYPQNAPYANMSRGFLKAQQWLEDSRLYAVYKAFVPDPYPEHIFVDKTQKLFQIIEDSVKSIYDLSIDTLLDEITGFYGVHSMMRDAWIHDDQRKKVTDELGDEFHLHMRPAYQIVGEFDFRSDGMSYGPFISTDSNKTIDDAIDEIQSLIQVIQRGDFE